MCLSSFTHSEGAEPGRARVEAVLKAVRAHLGMDVGFVSEFIDDHRVFQHVDDPRGTGLIKPGDSLPLEEGYCQRVVTGQLPELIPDTSEVAAALEIPLTATLPIGAHLSVPIRLKNGSVYGTFCCFSFAPDRSLNERDLQTMRAFADLAGQQIEAELAEKKVAEEKVRRIDQAIERDELTMVYQPIYALKGLTLVGVECLSRFAGVPARSPDLWFAEAAQVGRGPELEIMAIRKGLEALGSLPSDLWISFNVSPETLVARELRATLDGAPGGRVVLEVTEHAVIREYDTLTVACEELRAAGFRLAVDDAGAGYASLRHILKLKPEFIKLDASLIRDVDSDPARRALASAMVDFGRKLGSELIAEGVETEAELEAVETLGIDMAQGYRLGRPASLAGAPPFVAWCRAA